MASKSTKGRKNSKSRQKKGQKNTELRGEIIILAVLAVCILLVLSNFGVGGIVGEAVSSVFFGLFGFMAYLLPFVLFGLAAFLVSNRGNAHAYVKIAASTVLFLLITAILELIFNSYTPGASLLSYYTAASEHRNAGGLTGGCLISLLCPLIGVIGTYVVLVILSVICVILITEKSLLAPLGRQSRKAYEDAKKKHQETAAIRAKEREERQRTEKIRKENDSDAGERRTDHKVSGVSFATTLGDDETPGCKGRGRKKKSPDVYELMPEDMQNDEYLQVEPENTFVINRAEPQDIISDETEHISAGKAVQGTGELQEQETENPERPSGRRNKVKEAAEVSAETENVAAAVEKGQENSAVYLESEPVVVQEDEGKKIMYLTFDDGPSQNTQAVLDILEEYDAKATFFVTAEFSDYLHLIRAEKEAGHAIGVHTYSHRYDQIYADSASYWDDVEKMQKIIEEQCGSRTSILRFPGGTSNTISQRYAQGIMSQLAEEAEQKSLGLVVREQFELVGILDVHYLVADVVGSLHQVDQRMACVFRRFALGRLAYYAQFIGDFPESVPLRDEEAELAVPLTAER